MHQDDSDDDMGGSSLLFSDKQIPELALYYPDYGRLKTLVNELALGGSGTSALRSSIDMKRTSSSSAERVAAAGSGEVEFRTALDTELSRVNQFVVQSSAELRAHVSDLDKDSMDFGRNVNELKATAQRCMKQVMQLDDFSSLSQSIFLRILNEHDAVSDVPMLLQFSQKLFYQPFMQTKCSDLAGPLATIESRLEARTSDAEEEAAAFESTSKSGLEMPLLTKRQNTLTHIKVVELKPKTGFRRWFSRTFNVQGSATGAIKKLTPAKIEPKVYFANERTFLHWMHMCVTLGAVAMAIMAEGADDPALALPGLLLTATSAVFILYAWYMFMWRAEALKAKVDHLDDRVGPSLFVVAVLGSLAFVGYKKLQQASENVTPY